MVFIKRNLTQLIRLNYNPCRGLFVNHVDSHDSDIVTAREKTLKEYYKNLFELSEKDLDILLRKNPCFLHNKPTFEEVTQSFNFLKSLNFTNSSILKRPAVLTNNERELREKEKVLEEFCFQYNDITFFAKLLATMRIKILELKSRKIIANEANVPESLMRRLDIDLLIPQKLTDDLTMLELKNIITKHYFEKKFGITSLQSDDFTTVRGKVCSISKDAYQTIYGYSFESIVKTVSIIHDKLGLSVEQITKHKKLVLACPINVERMIQEIPSIGGRSIKAVIRKNPSIILRDVDDIKSSIKKIKDFGLTEKLIAASPTVLTRVLTKSSDNVCDLLSKFQKFEELNIYKNYPRALNVVLTQKEIVARNKHLSKLSVKPASSRRILASRKGFEKYTRDGYDPSKGLDLVEYISELFKRKSNEMKPILSRHPYWREIPLTQIKETLNYLRRKNFSDEDISDNILLLLYPPSQIHHKLQPLIEKNSESDSSDQRENVDDLRPCRISNIKLLNLCLYHIEKEFHFSGDGIWNEDQKPNTVNADFNENTVNVWKQQAVS